MPTGPEQILPLFGIDAHSCRIAPHGRGSIHETYRVETPDRVLILQKINRVAFPDPESVMDNIVRATRHLAAKLRDDPDAERRVLTFLPTLNGRRLAQGEDGSCWRCSRFVERTRCLRELRSPESAYEAAFAFAEFARLLSDLPPPKLKETIPHFHDAPLRLLACERAARKDVCGRVDGAKRELAEMEELSFLAPWIADARNKGAVPERIVHNDTKIDNALFDEATGKAVCIIDLDTIMPGSALSDFGDFVRVAANPLPDDAPFPEQAELRLAFFEASARGFLEGWRGQLTKQEIELMPLSGACIAFELAARFLTDHLSGDVYFRTEQPGRNLIRCRMQLRMARQMFERRSDLERIVRAAAHL